MKFVMPIEGRSAEQLYDLNRNGSGGFYPIGLNNSYHGGMHFEGERLPVVAIADGIIVAYRLTSEYLEERSSGKTYKYSNCFVLIKHEYKTPKGQEFTFYSHYNHLAPWNDLTTWMPENGRYPHFVVKPGYKIKKDGVKVYKKTEKKNANILPKTLKNREHVVASPVTGKKDWAKIDGVDEYFICTGGNAEKKLDVVCIPELDKVVTRDIPVKAGTIIGYSGLCEAEGAPERYAAVHVEVFADEDAEDFIDNVKGDGKPTLLKLAERQELKHRNKVYTDLSALPKYTRNKGTEVQIIKEEGAWVHVKDVNLAGIVEHAWLIDKYDTQKNHYTVNDAYIEQVKAQFPGVDIDGEEATDENKRTVTSATHFKYKSRQGTTSRVITMAAGSAAQQYWIKRAFLINNKEIKADNCDLWSDNPDKVVVTTGGAVPYHCVVPSNEQITEDNVVWHRVGIGEIGGWVKEPEVVKVSPYDWLRCNFGVIKEQKDEGFSLFSSGSENDSQIDYKKLPAFFQQIFDRIDSNHDKIISDQELRNIMRDPRWARFLSHMICYHQTEWCAEAHGEQIERVKRHLGQDAAERLKARIRQLCWWDSVSERPGSKQLYHWSPVALVEHMNLIGGFQLSFDELKRIATSATDANINKHLNGINEALRDCGIDTGLKVAHFVAQVIQESGSLQFTDEQGHTDDDYEGYKGRGLMQLTWLSGYQEYGNFVGEDFTGSLENKQKLEKDPHAAKSAGWVWACFKDLNDDGERNDLIYITYRINGGFNGYDGRLKWARKGIEVLCPGQDINTNYTISASLAAEDLKACFGWGVWHDPGTVQKVGCAKNKDKALEGYRAFVELHDLKGKPVPERNWYDHNKNTIRNFVDGRITALS